MEEVEVEGNELAEEDEAIEFTVFDVDDNFIGDLFKVLIVEVEVDCNIVVISK